MGALLAQDDAELRERIAALVREHPRRTQSLEDGHGRRIWVKTPIPARLRWIYAVLNGVARSCGMPYFQAPPHAGGPGGAAALIIEEARLRALAAAGVPVPQVVASAPGWLAIADVGPDNLEGVLRDTPAPLRYAYWARGLRAIADAHARGCSLSQCFARNIVLDARLGLHAPLYFIDFEEEPTKVMSLAQAQARDWAFYLHSTAIHVAGAGAGALNLFLDALDGESAATRAEAVRLLRQLAVLRWLRPLRRVGKDAERLYALGRFAEEASRRAAPRG